MGCAEEKRIQHSNPTGILIDDRDDRIYQTVKIGDRWWMAENLNYGVQMHPSSGGTPEPSDNDIAEKYCYDHNETLCEIYGALYPWDEAMNYSSNEGARGLRPEGWHVPSRGEFQDLLSLYPDCPQLRVGGESGFNAPLSGNRGHLFFGQLDELSLIWTSSGFQLYKDYILISISSGPVLINADTKFNAFSVRCIKDHE